MTSTTVPAELNALGDDLERAASRQLMRRRRRLQRAGAGVAVLLLIGAGTAAAGLFTPKQVASGMPAGTAIFGETDPTCTLNADGGSYDCVLATAPTRETNDFTGSKELLAINGKIAGGCIGQDVDGMRWTCYIGEDAVRHEILVQDLLGQPALAPGRG